MAQSATEDEMVPTNILEPAVSWDDIPQLSFRNFFSTLFRYAWMKIQDMTIHQLYRLYVIMYISISEEYNEFSRVEGITEESTATIESIEAREI